MNIKELIEFKKMLKSLKDQESYNREIYKAEMRLRNYFYNLNEKR
jgi:hypothetical protein